MAENTRPGGRRRPWWKRKRPACRRNRSRRWTRQSVHRNSMLIPCSAPRTAMFCTGSGWSSTAGQTDRWRRNRTVRPPESSAAPVRSAAWCAGSGWPRWAICCSSNPRMSGIPLRCAGCAAAPCGEALQEMLPRRKKRPEDPGPRHRTPRSDNENMVKCGK